MRLFRLLLGFELALADDGTPDGAVPEHLTAIVSADAKRIEAPIELFQHGFTFHECTNSRGGAMNNVDRRAKADLIALAEGQQRFETCCLHPSDHGGRRQHRRKFFPPRCQGVLELDTSLHFAARADGNWFGHES